MTLLIPLGLLGLLSIIALIVIYIIKPNYQQKEVTSTYIWKLSLKYRKRRLPTSKLRNILLIICQVLALVAGALIMAQPIIRNDKGVSDTEVIAIIDASASMRTENASGVTRFERAVDEVIDLSNRTITGGGYMSVILSNGNDNFIAQKAGTAARNNLISTLNALTENRDSLSCSYGKTDLDDSIALCEDIVKSNPAASIYIYTDKDYAYVPDGMTVVNVSDEDEWNVGILSAHTQFEEGYYTFLVEVGCYGGVARETNITVSINGANENKELVTYSTDVVLNDDSVTTVIFRNAKITEADYEKDSENVKIVEIGSALPDQNYSTAKTRSSHGVNETLVYGFDNVFVTVDANDSLASDDSFSIYGGRKPQLKIQYATTKRMPLTTTLFGVLRTAYQDSYELVVDIVDVPDRNKEPASEGYDFYLFERYTPPIMPRDGVVWLFNPPVLPEGLTSGGTQNYNQNMYFVQDNYHSLVKFIDASQICVTSLTRLSYYDDTKYQSLWSVDNNPVLLLNDGEYEKVIVALFDIEWSNTALTIYWAYFMKNIIETYLPPTTIGNAFEVGQEITVKARGNSVTVSQNSGANERVLTGFPATLRLDTPDTYRLSQINYFSNEVPDYYIFVKIPSAESNISADGITLKAIYRETARDNAYDDLLVYFAAAMLALLFTEWFLQTQESL